MSEPVTRAETEAGPFLRADEERDIEAFAGYVATLTPDALWDVLSHLDEDRYPRRREVVQRELTRRRLFFVIPYTRFEMAVRTFLAAVLLAVVFLAALAALVYVIASFDIEAPYGSVPNLKGLALGNPRAARAMVPVVLPFALLAAAATYPLTLYVLFQLLRRRVRREIVLLCLMAAFGVGLLLLFVLP